MTSLRDKVNSHLPILLKILSTASLVVLALSALCASKSLKRMAEAHQTESSIHVKQDHILKHKHTHEHEQCLLLLPYWGHIGARLLGPY